MENTKDNSKSLYLYTALIFIVALVMIVISFFGQSNLEKTNKAIQDQKSITEKAAAISEENMKLVERNLELEKVVLEKDAQISTLSTELETKTTELSARDALISAYALCSVKNYKKAKEIIETIDYEALEGDSKVLYTQILEEVN